MGSEEPGQGLMEEQGQEEFSIPYYLQKFALFETPSNFYMVGRNEQKTHLRVLKIGRSDPSKLVIYEDPTTYSCAECKLLLQGMNAGNKLGGGLKFVSTCFGIVGPYYMILITERREIGQICCHPIYAVSGYRMIHVPCSAVWSLLDNFERENSELDRYKKLLQLVDIANGFFFSYTYPIMHSLQRNLCKLQRINRTIL